MKSIFKFVAVFVISGLFLLNSVKLLADDEALGGHPSDWEAVQNSGERNYDYATVHNNNDYQITVRVNGQREYTVFPHETVVIPGGTNRVEVITDPLTTPTIPSAPLNVELNNAGERGNLYYNTPIPVEPTGWFPPASLTPHSTERLLNGACHPNDQVGLNIRRLRHSDYSQRVEGATQLGRLRDREAVRPLLNAINDGNQYVRQSAAYALGRIGDRRAAEPLIQRLNSDNSAFVRTTACAALGKVGGEQAVRALSEAARSQSQDAGFTSRAIRALGDIGTEDAAIVLRGILREGDSSSQRDAARILGNIGGRENAQALEQALTNEDSGVRGQAVQSLGEIGDQRSLGTLEQVLRGSDENIKADAAYAIGRIGGQRATDILRDALSNDSSAVRGYALEHLIDIGANDERTVNAIRQVVRDNDEYLRGRAVYALGEIGNERAVDDLIKTLGDESEEIRRKAAVALGKIGRPEATEALRTALKDEDEYVRLCSQRALEQIEGREEIRTEERQRRVDESINQRMLKLNEAYMEDAEMLRKLDPESEEAKARRHRMEVTAPQIRDMIREEQRKYGTRWADGYRDAQGRLPGGLIEDGRSRLVKLQNQETGQLEKVQDLERRIRQLSSETRPVESWEERLRNDQRAFREQFIRENGDSQNWNEATRNRYQREFSALTETSRRRWEQDRERVAQKNRELGRAIMDLVSARRELDEINDRTADALDEANAAGQIPELAERGQDKVSRQEAEEQARRNVAACGAAVGDIQGYAVDYTDDTIGFWNSGYPHLSFDDEEGRRGLPNGVWEGSYYFQENTLYLVIDDLRVPYPPLHTLGIGYTVTLEGATFEDGSNTKYLILYRYSGTPDQTRIVQSFRIIPRTRGDEE